MNNKFRNNQDLKKLFDEEKRKNNDLQIQLNLLEEYCQKIILTKDIENNPRRKPVRLDDKINNKYQPKWVDTYLRLKNMYDSDLVQVNNVGFGEWQDEKILDFWKQYILILCNYLICYNQYIKDIEYHIQNNNIECDEYIEKIQNNINFYKHKIQKIYHKYTKKRVIKLNNFKEKKKEIMVNIIESLKTNKDIDLEEIKNGHKINMKKYSYNNNVCKSEIKINDEITLYPHHITPHIINAFLHIEELEKIEHQKRLDLIDILNKDFYKERIYDEIIELTKLWFGERFQYESFT